MNDQPTEPAAGTLNVHCPHCDAVHLVREQVLGKLAKCTHCDQRFVLRENETSRLSEPPADPPITVETDATIATSPHESEEAMPVSKPPPPPPVLSADKPDSSFAPFPISPPPPAPVLSQTPPPPKPGPIPTTPQLGHYEVTIRLPDLPAFNSPLSEKLKHAFGWGLAAAVFLTTVSIASMIIYVIWVLGFALLGGSLTSTIIK